MTMAQQVLVAGVGMIRIGKMGKFAYKNETRLGPSCQRSRVSRSDRERLAQRRKRDHCRGHGRSDDEPGPDRKSNRGGKTSGDPYFGKRARRGSISPSRHGWKMPFGGVDLAYGSEA